MAILPVATPELNVRAKIAGAEKENIKAPDYRIFAGRCHARRSAVPFATRVLYPAARRSRALRSGK